MTKLPLFRQVAWLYVIPQILQIGLFVICLRFLAGMPESRAVWTGALLYLVYTVGVRAFLAQAHKAGMQRIKSRDYKGAIGFFQVSYDFFQRHSWLDRYRMVFLGSTNKMSYREMALVNMAYCFGQLGMAEPCLRHYERALAEFPDSVIARQSLDRIGTLHTSRQKRGSRVL